MELDGVKIIDLGLEGFLMPPPAHLCQACACDHLPGEPHNWQSMHWLYWYRREHKRWPTVLDAFAHCHAEVVATWKAKLKARAKEQVDPAYIAEYKRVLAAMEPN